MTRSFRNLVFVSESNACILMKKPNVLTYKLPFRKGCQREGFPFCIKKTCRKNFISVIQPGTKMQSYGKCLQVFLPVHWVHHKADNLLFSSISKYYSIKYQPKWFWYKLQRTIKIQFITNISPPKKALKFSVVLYHPKEDMYFHPFFTCFYKKSWWNYHSQVISSLCPLDANKIWSSKGHYHRANLCNKPVYNIFLITSKIILHNLSPWILNVTFRPNQIPFGYYFVGFFYSLSLSVPAYCLLGCSHSTAWDRDWLLLRGFSLVYLNPEFPWLKSYRVTAKHARVSQGVF